MKRWTGVFYQNRFGEFAEVKGVKREGGDYVLVLIDGQKVFFQTEHLMAQHCVWAGDHDPQLRALWDVGPYDPHPRKLA